MIKQFVTYEMALKLKELGFDEECFALYRNGRLYLMCNFLKINSTKESVISAPLWQQVIDWFREEYDIHVGVTPYTNPAKGINDVMQEIIISTKTNSYEGGWDNSIKRIHGEANLNLYLTYMEAQKEF